MITGKRVTFTLLCWLFKIVKQPDGLKLNHRCLKFCRVKGTPEPLPAHVMREIKLCKPVWKKKETVSYISFGRRTPWRCSASEIPTYLTALSKCCTKLCQIHEEKCVRKSGCTSLLSGENSSSKDGSTSSWGLYLAVTQSENIGKNRGLKGRARADGGQTGCIWSHQLRREYRKAEVLHHRQAVWHSGPFFLSDILMASFMEISHFPVCPREKRRTLFLSKGYRQGNTSALMLWGVFKAGRTQEDGNESVRSCKNECQKENESGIGNELCILWDPCVCKGFVSYHPPPSLSPPPLLFLLFPRWSWVRGWAAAWGGKSARLKLSFWHCMKPSWQPFQVTTPRCSPSYISRLLFTSFNQIAHH